MAGRKLGVYMSPAMEAVVKDRESHDTLSGRLGTVAERYLKIVQRHKPTLTEAEWNACRDALNGVWLREAEHLTFVWAEIADSDRLEGLGKKWGIDAQALAERVRAMPYAELVALIESVESWWATK
jgi:hypothetical protein